MTALFAVLQVAGSFERGPLVPCLAAECRLACLGMLAGMSAMLGRKTLPMQAPGRITWEPHCCAILCCSILFHSMFELV